MKDSTSLDSRITYPIREIQKHELEDPKVVEECLEHVMYAQVTYKIICPSGKDILMLPIGQPMTTLDVTIDLSEEQYFYLLQEAHRRDITLNQLIAIILSKHVENDLAE